MAFFKQKQKRRERVEGFLCDADGTGASLLKRLRSYALSLVGLLAVAVALTLVCFWGRPTHLPVFIPNTVSRVDFHAAFDFEYISKEVREQRVREGLQNLAPVYRIAFEPLSKTDPYRQLMAKVGDEAAFDALKKLPDGELEKACVELAKNLPGAAASVALASVVRHSPDAKTCGGLLGQTADAVERILRGGVYESVTPETPLEIGSAALATTTTSSATSTANAPVADAARPFIPSAPSLGIERAVALRDLADAIAATPGSPLHGALLALFRPAVAPNIQKDLPGMEARRREFAEKVGPVRVSVREGDLLVERGGKITPFVTERWEVYRGKLPEHARAAFSLLDALRANLLPVFTVVLFAAMFLRLAPPAALRRRHITLAALLIPANLLLIRFFLDLGEQSTVLRHAGPVAVGDFFLWFAPPSLAAFFLALLGGRILAAIGAFAVSILAALIFGHSLDVFIVAALSNVVAIHFCAAARSRNDILRAGLFSGGVTALALALVFQTSGGGSALATVLQVGGSLVGGIVLGLFALALLPVFEAVFKLTSRFSYSELASSRNPLLAKLQIIAPGTHNHSANVATLAEAAAAAIGANATLCHCAALYHDIGKMLKPEYFIENQQAGNPHEHTPPAISATVIKSHVREGAELARAAGLPRAIIEIIEQHHGDGLIEYFHTKALKAARDAGLPDDSVDTAAYRYQNPRPRTREAAITLLADSLEAATRTLKHYTPKNIGQLVDRITAARIADGQLDECPLTFREVQVIRGSFKKTLESMYHHRIAYPATAPRADAGANAANTANVAASVNATAATPT